MSDENDSWLKSTLGIDVPSFLGGGEEASTAVVEPPPPVAPPESGSAPTAPYGPPPPEQPAPGGFFDNLTNLGGQIVQNIENATSTIKDEANKIIQDPLGAAQGVLDDPSMLLNDASAAGKAKGKGSPTPPAPKKPTAPPDASGEPAGGDDKDDKGGGGGGAAAEAAASIVKDVWEKLDSDILIKGCTVSVYPKGKSKENVGKLQVFDKIIFPYSYEAGQIQFARANVGIKFWYNSEAPAIDSFQPFVGDNANAQIGTKVTIQCEVFQSNIDPAQKICPDVPKPKEKDCIVVGGIAYINYRITVTTKTILGEVNRRSLEGKVTSFGENDWHFA